MGVIYVAGERPGAGATAVAASLAVALHNAGHDVAAAKPLTLAAGDPDAGFLSKVPFDRTEGYASEAHAESLLVADSSVSDDQLREASERVQLLAAGHDAVIAEGLPLVDADGAGLALPSATLASRLYAKVIGVVHYRRSLGQADLAVWRDTFGDALAGIVINRSSVYAGHDIEERLRTLLKDAGVPVLGVLAEERFMLAPTVQQVVELLDATVYVGAPEDQRLVEHFLIGGLIMEWGGNYFGRLPNQGVIVRGGRMDIQMSALNFPLNCLLLTACDTPPQYVYQRADAQDVPLMVVAGDTHETALALEGIAERVSVHHVEKIARLAGAWEAADWDAVKRAGGLA